MIPWKQCYYIKRKETDATNLSASREGKREEKRKGDAMEGLSSFHLLFLYIYSNMALFLHFS